MKLIYQEDGQEIVYIQRVDLEFLYAIHYPMPESITSNFLTSPISNDTNKEADFFWFQQIEEINFFKALDCIIDYQKFINTSNSEIEMQAQRLYAKIEELTSIFNQKTDQEKLNSLAMRREHDCLAYQLDCLSQLYQLRLNNQKIMLPKAFEKKLTI